jgi:hypothetical protein
MYIRSLTIFIAGCLFAATAMAQKTWDRGANSNNWGDANNWSPNGVPGAGDAVIIPDASNAKSIIVNVDANCASLTLSSGNDNVKLSIHPGRTLNVAGALTVGSPSGFLMAKEIEVGNGNLVCGAFNLSRTTGFLAATFFTIHNGTASIAGNVTMQGSLLENFLAFTGNGTMQVGGNISGGIIIPGNGTVEFNGALPQVIPNYIYNNLTVSGGSLKTLGGSRIITGDLVVEGFTPFHLGSHHLTLYGNGSKSVLVNGHLHINGSGRLTTTGNGQKSLILGQTGYLWLTGTGTALPDFDVYDFHGNSVVEYGANGNQTVSSKPKYGNMVTGGSGTKTINGNSHAVNSIVIAANTTLASFNGAGNEIQMGGTWVNNGNFAAYDNTVTFKGSSQQLLMGTTPTVFNNVNISSLSLGILLNQPITIKGKLTLNAGYIVTSATNLLTMTDNSSTVGANQYSFVAGPMRKIGNDAFVFPVGAIGVAHQQIGISAPSSTSSAYDAEYVRASGGDLGPVTAAGITSVSGCEYWKLTRTAGTSNVNVSLYWTPVSGCGGGAYIANMNDVSVASFNGASWNAAGRNSTSGNLNFGSVTWNNVSSFGTFTLGFANTGRGPVFVEEAITAEAIEEIVPLTLYPNPVRGGQVYLRATELAKGDYSARVFNAAGQLVTILRFNHSGGAVSQTVTLPAGTNTGLYTLQLETGGRKVLGKSFVVQQ